METLDQKLAEAQKFHDKFTGLMDKLNNSPGQGPHDEVIVKSYYQETEGVLESVTGYLGKVNLPLPELRDDVTAVEKQVEELRAKCRSLVC